jgi:hypothetical protein
MLCSNEDRIRWLIAGRCPDCGGCINDECHGCTHRWCGGTYEWWAWTMPQNRHPHASPCDRCPYKVSKPRGDGTRSADSVRCNGKTGHTGTCHWNPAIAGTQPNPTD